MSLSEYNKFKKDLSNSKTHGYMHLPEENKKEIFSFHHREKHKTIWYKSGYWVNFESKNSPTNPEFVSYYCPTFPHHSLHRSLLSFKTPKIKAKDNYKIKFCDNLFVNMIKNFYLTHNDIDLQHGNTSYILKDLKTNSSSELVKELESKFLSIELPYFYSKYRSSAFPLIYCGQKDDLVHRVEFNLDFSNLVLIFDEDDNLVKFNKDLIEIENNMEMMPIPEMEGLCSFLDESDAKLVNSKSDENLDGDKELYTESMYYLEDENEVMLDKKVLLKFPLVNNQPVNSIYWGAINKTLTDTYKNLSFVKLNPFNNSESPVNSSKLTSTSGVIVDNKSSDKTEFAYHRKDGVVGISKWKNSVNEKEDGKKFVPGLKFSGGSLIVKLKNDSENNDKFIVFCMLEYVKRFRFISYPKTFQERKDMRSSLVPDEDE
jgi:hypothetical protein